MRIRAATEQDCPAISSIWNEVILKTDHTFNNIPVTEEALKAELALKAKTGQAFLLAEDSSAILGFATYGQFRKSNGYRNTCEHTIHLAPDAQGKGIGRALMTSIEHHAKQARVHSMIAGISHVNDRAVAFHASLGYTEIARLPEVGTKFGRWYDLILMQKILSSSLPE